MKIEQLNTYDKFSTQEIETDITELEDSLLILETELEESVSELDRNIILADVQKGKRLLKDLNYVLEYRINL